MDDFLKLSEENPEGIPGKFSVGIPVENSYEIHVRLQVMEYLKIFFTNFLKVSPEKRILKRS